MNCETRQGKIIKCRFDLIKLQKLRHIYDKIVISRNARTSAAALSFLRLSNKSSQETPVLCM